MTKLSIPQPPVAMPQQWLASRKTLLLHEKELTRQRDRVNAERRRLPMTKIERAMEPAGLEPATFWMQTRRSPN